MADTFSGGRDLSSLNFSLYSITSHDLRSNRTLADLLRMFAERRGKGRGILSRPKRSQIASS